MTEPLSKMVLAVLNEIAAKLQRLAETGATSVVDLHRLPLQGGDFEALRAFLGRGEVDAAVEALGTTSIRETRFKGVWHVLHRNADGIRIGEQIEITRCPEMLEVAPEDTHDGLAALRSALTAADTSD